MQQSYLQREFITFHILPGHRQHVDTCSHVEVKIMLNYCATGHGDNRGFD